MPITEDTLTQWFRTQRTLDPHKVPIGIGDDMAQVSLAPHQSVLITADMLLEGVHFDLSQATLDQVGYKTMAVSLSDCAAMACRPAGAVISLGLPRTMDPDDLKALHAGFLRAADRFDCPIVGGDLTRWSESRGLVINATLFGVPMGDQPVRRSGACAEDVLMVTGTLGGSLTGHHLDFCPRLAEAQRLIELVEIHAMMDLSDGLGRDLPRLCQASQVGALLDRRKIPLSKAALARNNPIQAALQDGEDFELLFAVSPADAQYLQNNWDLCTPLQAIGHCTGDPGLRIQDENGHGYPLEPDGYDHFRN